MERRIGGILLIGVGGAMAVICAQHLSSHTYEAMSLFELIYLNTGVLFGALLIVGGVAMLIARRSPDYITDPPHLLFQRTKEELPEIRTKK